MDEEFPLLPFRKRILERTDLVKLNTLFEIVLYITIKL